MPLQRPDSLNCLTNVKTTNHPQKLQQVGELINGWACLLRDSDTAAARGKHLTLQELAPMTRFFFFIDLLVLHFVESLLRK